MLRYLISGYSALLSSIEVNTTWIFFWISKRLISFRLGLVSFQRDIYRNIYSTSNTLMTYWRIDYWRSVKGECLHFSYLWRYVCKWFRLTNVLECFCRWKVKCSTFSLTNVSIHFRMIYLKGSIRYRHKQKMTKLGSRKLHLPKSD